MSLPSLEEPEPGMRCFECGEPIRVIGFCAECDDRLAAEKRREDSNEYRRQAQIRLELAEVRQRVTRYLRGE